MKVPFGVLVSFICFVFVETRTKKTVFQMDTALIEEKDSDKVNYFINDYMSQSDDSLINGQRLDTETLDASNASITSQSDAESQLPHYDLMQVQSDTDFNYHYQNSGVVNEDDAAAESPALNNDGERVRLWQNPHELLGNASTNYPISGVKVVAPRNYAFDSRLRSDANLINRSDVLHLEDDDAPTNDSASSRSPEDAGEDNLAMAWWVQLAWTAVFVLMILVAIGGNCIVMWIVIAHKRMRTVTNYFLVNLSCADLLLSTLNCFFNFIYMLQGNWQFGGWYCTVNNFIANTTVAASVFTLTAMCCDRHFAIVHPLHPRMSKVTAIVVICLIWCFSMALAAPCLLYSTTITYRSNTVERTACILIWPDGQPTDSQLDFGCVSKIKQLLRNAKSYQVLFLVITYVVPMALMSFFYTSIGKVLWGSESIGERTRMQLDAIRSKRKVVKMIIFIVLVFAICWLPYHAYFIYTHFDRSILYTRYVQHVYLAFYWFAMANAMVNPLIYYWMNAKFRGYFRRAICWWRPLDPELDANLNGRTFKSTRCEVEETRISLRQMKHSHTQSTTSTKFTRSR